MSVSWPRLVDNEGGPCVIDPSLFCKQEFNTYHFWTLITYNHKYNFMNLNKSTKIPKCWLLIIFYRCIYTVIWILIVIHFNLPGNFKILTSIFSHTLYQCLTVNFGILNTISKQIPWICLWGSRRSIYLCTSVFHILNMPIFFSVQSNFWRL